MVVANQVTDVVSHSEAPLNGGMISSGRQVKPALGMVWTQSIFQRLIISRQIGIAVDMEKSNDAGLGISNTIETVGARDIAVGFAPHLPPLRCGFVITEAGVSGLA